MTAPSPCIAPGSPEHPSQRNYQRSCYKGAEPCWRPCLSCAQEPGVLVSAVARPYRPPSLLARADEVIE
jgi:hypothetical protein